MNTKIKHINPFHLQFANDKEIQETYANHRNISVNDLLRMTEKHTRIIQDLLLSSK